jgi:type IV secretion system protein VirB1
MITEALLACALTVAPGTAEKIIRAESGADGNPLAMNVNHLAGPQPHATSVAEAASLIRKYITAGFSVDIGVMQINSRNLAGLGLTIEDALEPCTNVRGGGAILTADYDRAATQFGEGQQALLAAISAYNTGSWSRGFANGYVARVVGIPAMANLSIPAKASAQPAPPNPYTATTVAYSREDMHVRIE